MKFLNKFSVLLLLFFFSFQACVEEELTRTEVAPVEVATFKSIDQLPTDDRFVDIVLGTISIKANADQLERAQELMNQENLSAKDQAEVAQIMGYDSWDAYTAFIQMQQELIKELNAEYNLEAYEPHEIEAYSTQVYDYVLERKIEAMGDVVIGDGGGIDPCIQACNADLALCLLAEGIANVLWSVGCIFSTDPHLCHIVNIIGTGIGIYNCITTHAACVAAC